MNTPCILWTGARNTAGYGVRRHNGKNVLTHRLALCEAQGLDLDDIIGKVVMHSCDTPACHNPDHLRLGTQKDNMLDMFKKGRDVQTLGEDHCHAVLTEKQVAEIRERYEPGINSHRSLAKEYGVGHTTIGQVLRGQTWRAS